MELEKKGQLFFKDWLYVQISSGKFMGLEWIDRQHTQFKLPWTQRNHPDWEKHHRIFLAWARHRAQCHNKKIPTKIDDTMKSNFRSILSKCPDIELVADRCDFQTGNHKIYKFLTTPDFTEMFDTLSLIKHETSESIPTVNLIDTEEIEMQGEVDSTHQKSTMEVSQSHNGEQLMQIPCDERCGNAAAPIQTSWHPNASTTTGINQGLHPIPPAMIPLHSPEFPSIDNVSWPCPVSRFPPACDNAAANSMNCDDEQSLIENVLEKLQTLSGDHPSATSKEIWHEILDDCSIPREQLDMYELRVKYEDEEILLNTYSDMDQGYRLHYGDHRDQQCKLLFQDTCPFDIYDDFHRSPITLPEPKNPTSESFKKVLEKTDSGIVINSDENLALWGKRLCQSRIFAFAHYGCGADTSEAILMARLEKVQLFSYQKFLETWYSSAQNRSPLPDPVVHLAFGKKPRTWNSRVFINAKLVPKAAESLKNLLTSSLDSLKFSSEKSYDKQIRKEHMLPIFG